MTNYQKFNEILGTTEGGPSAAELHGLVCGFICAGNKMDGKSWIDPILSVLGKGNKKRLNSCKERLLEMHEVASAKMQSFDFDFELFLPEDEVELQVRAEALSHWCQGFIIALNRVQITIEDLVSVDAKEAITHIVEISKLDYESIDVKDQDEQAYAEVMEYVRMAVLMVYSEIALEQGREGSGGRHLH